MRAIFAGGCACAASGHVAAALPSNAIKSRRLILTPLGGRRLARPFKLQQKHAASMPPAHGSMVPRSQALVVGDLNRSESGSGVGFPAPQVARSSTTPLS